MKAIVIRYPVIAALAFALILLSCPAFAQSTTTQKAVTSDGVSRDAGVTTGAKEAISDSREPVQQAPVAIKPSAVLISFWPADLLDPMTRVERTDMLRMASLEPPSVKKAATRDNQDDPAALAKKLRNPVSSLARISFENNFDFGLAANREGYRYTMNLEPVIPFALGKSWNLISRTRLPVIQQDGVVQSTMQTGLGDILQSFFLSPSKAQPVFWGAGATMLIPTATDTRLGTGKFGIGPTAVVGVQHHAWTYGALARQIWSVAGHSDRENVRLAYIQPFVSYTTRSAWTYSLDTESTYDWVRKQWAIPINFEIAKVLRVAGHPISVGAAITCWAATPTGGPQACGARFTVTPLFPAR